MRMKRKEEKKKKEYQVLNAEKGRRSTQFKKHSRSNSTTCNGYTNGRMGREKCHGRAAWVDSTSGMSRDDLTRLGQRSFHSHRDELGNLALSAISKRASWPVLLLFISSPPSVPHPGGSRPVGRVCKRLWSREYGERSSDTKTCTVS